MEKNIRNHLGMAIIGGIAALAVAALGYVWAYSRWVEVPSSRSFAVTGEGKITAIPDVAKFTFSVITEGGKNLSSLQSDNIKKTNQAIEFVKEQGVEDKDIETTNYSVEPRYQYSACPRDGGACPPPEIVGYTVTQTVAVKARDFSKVGDLLSGVVSAGANSVSQLSFSVDDPTRLENEARAKAIAQAREKAKEIAKAGGFRLGKLMMIDEGGYPPFYYEKGLGMGGDIAAASAPSPSIEPGSDEIKVTVTLRYEIR